MYIAASHPLSTGSTGAGPVDLNFLYVEGYSNLNFQASQNSPNSFPSNSKLSLARPPCVPLLLKFTQVSNQRHSALTTKLAFIFRIITLPFPLKEDPFFSCPSLVATIVSPYNEMLIMST